MDPLHLMADVHLQDEIQETFVDSLYDQRFILKDKGLVQHCCNSVVFGPGLEHQTLISWNLVLL